MAAACGGPAAMMVRVGAWWWQPDDLLEQACARLTRHLTRAEWQQYLVNAAYQPTCPNLPTGG